MPKMPQADLRRQLLSPAPPPVLVDRAGDQCRVRTLTPRDVSDSQLGWLNDPVVRSGLNIGGPALNLQDFRRYAASFDNIRRNLVGIWVETRLVGLIMFEIDPRHKRGSVHVVIGERDHHRPRLATEAVRLVVWHCFLERKVGKLSFEPLASNKAAIFLCRAGKLRLEGRLVEHRLNERTGERLDQLVFAMTLEEFKTHLLGFENLPGFRGPGVSPNLAADSVRAFRRERSSGSARNDRKGRR